MGATVNKPNQNWLKNVNKTILLNLDNSNLLVSDLAKSAFMSERQFYREIKKAMGLTPNQYIQQVKMGKAKEWITNRKYASLKKLSQALGYARTDYFSKVYEKHFNEFPNLDRVGQNSDF